MGSMMTGPQAVQHWRLHDDDRCPGCSAPAISDIFCLHDCCSRVRLYSTRRARDCRQVCRGHGWTTSLEVRSRCRLSEPERSATTSQPFPTFASIYCGRSERVPPGRCLQALLRLQSWAVHIKFKKSIFVSLLWTNQPDFDASTTPETIFFGLGRQWNM